MQQLWFCIKFNFSLKSVKFYYIEKWIKMYIVSLLQKRHILLAFLVLLRYWMCKFVHLLCDLLARYLRIVERISPNIGCSSNMGVRFWTSSIKLRIKVKTATKPDVKTSKTLGPRAINGLKCRSQVSLRNTLYVRHEESL